MHNVLFFDAFKAHAEYGKSLLELSLREAGVLVHVKYDIRHINRYIAENDIKSVVLFINDSSHYHHLLPFIALGVKVLVCSSAHGFHHKGLRDLNIPTLDLGLPKNQLFKGVRSFLFDKNSSDAVA